MSGWDNGSLHQPASVPGLALSLRQMLARAVMMARVMPPYSMHGGQFGIDIQMRYV